MLIKCERCHNPIAYGEVKAGSIQIECPRCKHKTTVVPDKKAA